MLLFEGDFGGVLHTGDCRLSEDCLKTFLGKYKARKTLLNCVYLDCTFGREHLKMPSRAEASLQVRQCIQDHPQAPIIYLAADMLGHEALLSDLAAYFRTKIYVDKCALPELYGDLLIVAPESVTTDPRSSRFHVSMPSKFQERTDYK
jgi:DNA cross-link repair 1A protein